MENNAYIYDQRQFRLMLKKFYLFKDGNILLNHLLSSVLSLAEVINNKKNIDLDRF